MDERTDMKETAAAEGDEAVKAPEPGGADPKAAADEQPAPSGAGRPAAKTADGDSAKAPAEGKGSPEGAEAQDDAEPAEAKHGAHVDEAAVAKKRKRAIGIGAAIAAVLVVAACGVGFALTGPAPEPEPDPAVEQAAEQAEVQLAENPIDWAEYEEINDNVYAWVYVPNTEVDLPVLQHPVAENWYLAHDIDGNDNIKGEIYSQGTHNSKDFTDDPVTVLYGHTFSDNDTMFTTLHNLEDAEFFEENPYFYIYTPESILTYQIISAYETDNKLILGKWDVADPDVQQEYFDFVADPGSWNQNLREMRRLVSGEDHIVQLSTCTMPSDTSKRFIVTGVLVSEEPTAPQEGAAEPEEEPAAAEEG